MTTPTPDEITAAHALLLRVPGFTGSTTLADVAAVMEPAALLAASMKDLLLERDVDIRDAHFMDIAALLSDLAARHGLRITTDPAAPGKLVGYQLLSEVPDGIWTWRHYDAGNWFMPNVAGLDAIRRDATGDLHAAAVYLLPEEGGQA